MTEHVLSQTSDALFGESNLVQLFLSFDIDCHEVQGEQKEQFTDQNDQHGKEVFVPLWPNGQVSHHSYSFTVPTLSKRDNSTKTRNVAAICPP